MMETFNYQQAVNRINELDHMERVQGIPLTSEQLDELFDLLYMKRDFEERPDEEQVNR